MKLLSCINTVTTLRVYQHIPTYDHLLHALYCIHRANLGKNNVTN